MAQRATVTTTTRISIAATSIEPEVEMGAPAANDESDLAQPRQVAHFDHGHAREQSRT